MNEQMTGRFTKEELNLIKSTFKDNLPLLKAIRKVFLQIELTEKEDVLIRNNIKDDVHAVVSKLFLPVLDGDANIKEVLDLMLTIDLVSRIPEDAKWHMRARKKLIKYLEQSLEELNGSKVKDKIKFNELDNLTNDDVEDYINLLTRNTLINHIETCLEKINITANQTELTEEEQKNYNLTNSNK